MKLNARHKLGLRLAKVLPPPWSWKLLKIPCGRVLAAEGATVVDEVKEDLSGRLPVGRGSAGEISGHQVFAVEGGYSTHWGANLTRDGRLITDISRQGIGVDKPHFSFGKPRMKSARYLKGSVATLTIEHRSNYFHFFCDSISRLQSVENLRHAPDYIYVQANQKYHVEISARLGYQPHQIIDSVQYPFIQAERLLVPSCVSNFSFLTENSVAFLRSRLVGVEREKPVGPGRIIYISRKDTPRRKLVNEDQLVARLAEFGVESVVLSGMSLDEQIQLFQSAAAVVTITGAGLANLLFAPKDLFLILITPPNWFGESALEIFKPFGLRFFNLVPSEYPQAADPFEQSISLTDEEIETIAHQLAQFKAAAAPVPLI